MTEQLDRRNIDTPPLDMARERRASPRRRVLRGVSLFFNAGYGAIEGTMRDESASGARLRFGDAGGVPSTFRLRIKGEDAERAGRVRWRHGAEIGIELEPLGY